MQLVQYVLRDVDDNKTVAGDLRVALSLPAVVALTGDLGYGKTTLAQYLAREYGITDFLASPTFTLINEFPFDDNKLFVHADLYRLKDETDIRHTGLEDYFTQDGTMTVVEWADRLPHFFPQNTIWLNFTLKHDHRIVTITADNPHFWHQLEGRL